MTPSTANSSGFSDAALPVGGTFNDPSGGHSITVQSVSAEGATINVTYTGGSGTEPTCLDGTPFVLPGPGIESCGPATGVGGAGGSAKRAVNARRPSQNMAGSPTRHHHNTRRPAGAGAAPR